MGRAFNQVTRKIAFPALRSCVLYELIIFYPASAQKKTRPASIGLPHRTAEEWPSPRRICFLPSADSSYAASLLLREKSFYNENSFSLVVAAVQRINYPFCLLLDFCCLSSLFFFYSFCLLVAIINLQLFALSFFHWINSLLMCYNEPISRDKLYLDFVQLMMILLKNFQQEIPFFI